METDPIHNHILGAPGYLAGADQETVNKYYERLSLRREAAQNAITALEVQAEHVTEQ